MKNTLGYLLSICAALVIVTGQANAQSRGKAKKPVPTQRQSIELQKRGQYPAFKRNLLPKGAINYNWATRCKPSDSTVSFLYSAGSEIRVRTRQLIGTVLVFPEVVSALTSGLGDAISLKGYPEEKSNASKIWILGSTQAGLDGNLAFIGGIEVGGPRIYSLRVQTEGVNSKNCPDMVVQIKSATDEGLTGVADRIARAMAGEPALQPAPSATPTTGVEQVSLDDGGEPIRTNPLAADSTGRQKVDWLEGFSFDPTKLNFKWTLGGDKKANFAPDIVFSDDEFMYLQWDPERMKKIILPAISAIIKTDRGKVDAPVTWVRRGDMVIVQRISDLTLEFEGLVVCVVADSGEKKDE